MVRYISYIVLACLAGGLPLTSEAESVAPTESVRYVWASQLLLRAGPDIKAAEVARLPYGSKVLLLPESATPTVHRETVAKLSASSEHAASEITLDGYWRHVKVTDKDGWVFDGYLSRYPAPGDEQTLTKYDDDEIAYAAQVFGVAHAWQWKKGDSKGSASYKLMRQKWKLDENAGAAEISWSRVEFKLGGSAEISTVLGDGSSSNLAIEGVPLTFNESLLWWLHFHPVNGSGIFKPPTTLQIGPSDDDAGGIGYDRIINCGSRTCSIRRDVID